MKLKHISLMLTALILTSLFSVVQVFAAYTDVIKYALFEDLKDNNKLNTDGYRICTVKHNNSSIGLAGLQSRKEINSTKYSSIADETNMAISGFAYMSTVKGYTNGWVAYGAAFVGSSNNVPSPKDISDTVENGVLKMEICLKSTEAVGKLKRSDFYVIMASYDSGTQKYSYKGINLTNTNYVDCAAGYGEFMPVSVPVKNLTKLNAIPDDVGAPDFDFKKVTFVGLAFRPFDTPREDTFYVGGGVDNIILYSSMSPIVTKFYQGTDTTANPIESMATGTVTVKSQVIPEAVGKLIIAKYNIQKEMDFLEIVDVGQNKQPVVQIPLCESTDIIKTFIIDSIENIKPVSGVSQLPQLQ